ncbi:MAG: hypothetical protein JO268_11105 [Pseudonocardiales bacterium]|nr:hypothetical protein [Pseudonocardiales bacterium]
MENRPDPQNVSSSATGKPGLAYDPERVGEPEQTGVPTGDQYPTNEGAGGRDDTIVADVDIPGPYPSGRGDPTGEPLSSEPEPTKATRGTGSLGDLTKDISKGTVGEETGGLGSPLYDEEKRENK